MYVLIVKYANFNFFWVYIYKRYYLFDMKLKELILDTI